jgi:hypothetical protein
MFTKEENYRARLVSRLRSILHMEAMLSQLMRLLSNYSPLEFHNIMPVISTDSQAMASLDPEENKAAKKELKSHASIKFSNVEDLRPYTRPFDVCLKRLYYSSNFYVDSYIGDFEI